MKILFVLLFVLLPLTAFAGFEVVNKPPLPVPAGSKATGPGAVVLGVVTYIGEPHEDVDIRRGFGRDVRLVDALKQIAPADWHATVSPELAGKFDKDRLVSWRGGHYWVEVLDSLSVEQGLLVSIDWNRRYRNVGQKVTVVAPVGARTVAGSAMVEKKLPVWVVKPGARLRAVIEEFAARAGWAVEINYKDEQTLEDKDLVLGGGLHSEGDFKKAIRDVFDALPASAKIDAELWPENTPPTVFIFRKGTNK